MRALSGKSQWGMNTRYMKTHGQDSFMKCNSSLFLQEHIDTAISLNSNNPNLFHLRGRWRYEVAGLSWLEKKAAAALYASPPESTYDQALNDFMSSERLNGDVWKANLMMVAKVSIGCFGHDLLH